MIVVRQECRKIARLNRSDYDSDYGSAPLVPDTNDSIHSYAPDSEIYSPDTSFDADTSLDEHDPRGQDTQNLRDLEPYGSVQKVGVASTNRGIPHDFWELFRRVLPDGDEQEAVREAFVAIWELQEEWVASNRNGFLTKSITGMPEQQFWLIQDVLARSWQWDLHTGILKHWISFLHCLHLDFWPQERRAYAIAPTFDDEFAFPIASTVNRYMSVTGLGWSKVTMSVAPRTIIRSPDVEFCIKYGVVRVDGHWNKLGREVSVVTVAQSRTEFTYQAKTMAAAVSSLKKLEGFMMVLIGDLGEGHDSLVFIPALKLDAGMRVECCVLSYQREEFVRFKDRAAHAVGFQDWENDTNFMPQRRLKHPPLQSRSKDWGHIGANLMSMVHVVSQQITGGLIGIARNEGKVFLGSSIGPYGADGLFRQEMYGGEDWGH
ncbi:uncharacterized protein B0H18DRAFT_960171 [Fomitopsis serialis]|uniref:uncharacterized protein n=1 Tax=Fomitopsis serialis TaxID=139415 RepID=UPI002007A9F1|nr:uncharacterized protein B0H18DRAFT_960171 [Neoantrodia serialis]KAH9913740.1 hypothetical protein B0H18DRAFT_960171 [Neoantrodia serialis]